jgi:hypothetical protein
MIVRPEYLNLIRRGRKTEHRMPALGDDCPVRRDQTLPVMTEFRGEPAEHVLVRSVRRQQLRDLTFADARAEGFRTRADFAHRYMRRWSGYRDHHRPDSDDYLLDLFNEWHGDDVVWAIAFEVIDAPLLLAPAAHPHGSVLGYTTRASDALPHEPESIDPARLHPNWTERAQAFATAAARDADATRLTGVDHPDEKLRELQRMALERGIDITDDLRVIEQRKAAIQRRLDEIARKVSRAA